MLRKEFEEWISPNGEWPKQIERGISVGWYKCRAAKGCSDEEEEDHERIVRCGRLICI